MFLSRMGWRTRSGTRGIGTFLVVPSWEANEREVVVVEYKYSEQKAGPHSFAKKVKAFARRSEIV